MSLTKAQRGKLSELIAITKAASFGNEVAFPFTSIPDVDFLIRRKSGDWISVQVKTASHNLEKRKTTCDLRRAHGSRYYQLCAFDYLFAVNPDTQEIWVFREVEIRKRTILTLKAEQKAYMNFSCVL